MARLSDTDLLEVVRDILLKYDKCPVKSSEDIRNILAVDYDIHYDDSRYFSKKLTRAVIDRKEIIEVRFVGNTYIYYLEDWKNAYSNNG